MKSNLAVLSALVFAAGLFNSLPSFGSEREGGGRRGTSAIKVIFKSEGAGIESDKLDKVLDYSMDSVRSGVLSRLTVIPWGREGEKTLCLEFISVQIARQEAEPALRAIAGSESRTRIEIAVKCD